ncbi:unnamed protein product [Menidia menidia]|uniref:protein-tyrosine-phosphatase n=1 Tax=Menidia menidia TaxID=238744 RepID=A0A8S4BBB0_9TELE|nr:unnamed protein product [Menidia menidia]
MATAARRSASTSAISCSSGSAESGVLWSGQEVYHAGIGRTGCFIATTIGCRQLQGEEVVDVLGITCQLRADRGGMIQTGEQYEFVHHALSLYEARLSSETGQ